MIELHALGQCLIRTGIASITPRADMCFALASYLSRDRGTRISRRNIEKLFWPAMHPGYAAHSLSELIHKLRTKGVVIERDDASCIWIPRDAASIDVDSLSKEPYRAIAERDLAILPGYEPRSSAAFSDWVDEWREQLRLRVVTHVVAAGTTATSQQDWSFALVLANQALGLEPGNDSALKIRARAADHLSRESPPSLRHHTLIVPGPSIPREVREPIRALEWRAVPSMATASRDTALVGRQEALSRLKTQGQRALHGEVCASYISAPAGIGKSRLIREIAGWMSTRGAASCIVSCNRHDGHRPMSAFFQAVPILQSLPGAAGCAPGTIECLSRITQVSSDTFEVSSGENPAQMTTAIRASVIDLIDAIADEQPLLLVVENVHWIDSASWSLLRTAAATTQRAVFLICTSRLGWQYQAWGAPESFQLEELTALDHHASRELMCNYLAAVDRDADDTYINWCIETSHGNPYFIEELINYWVATGERYSAPPALVALVESRLALVRPEALRVIQAAAILGKHSTVDLLQKVLEFPTHTLFSSIEELGEVGLLITPLTSLAADSAPIICRHDLVGRAATKSLSAQGRALLHHAAARSLEIANADHQSADLLWDCADHWHAAGQHERSAHTAIACAKHLHDMGLVTSAIKRCEATLATSLSPTTRVEVLRTLARSLYAAHEWRAFLTAAAEVHSLEATSITHVNKHDELELYELNAQRNLHRDWEPALLRTLICVHAEGADASHRVRAAIVAFSLATNVGALHAMDEVYLRIEPLLSSADVSQQDRLTFLMMYSTIRGDSGTSAPAARQLLALAEDALHPRCRMVTMLNCASALRRSGVSREAEVVCEQLFRLAVLSGCFDLAAEACERLIEMHMDGGELDRARRWVASYKALRRPHRELRSHRTLRVAMARVRAADGDWSAATRLLGSSRGNRLYEDSVVMLRSAALATKVRVDIGCGRPPDDVAELVDSLAQLNESLRTVGAQDYECYSLYLGLRYIGAADDAASYLNRYATSERRDVQPLAPEIAAEITRLGLGREPESRDFLCVRK